MADNIYIATQAILDRKEKITAYELLFRSPTSEKQAQVLDDVQATSRVLVNTLNSIGIETLLGNKTGFINLNEVMLHDEVMELLPADKFMLEILEFTQVDDKLIERVIELKQQNFKFAIDDLVFDEQQLKHFSKLFPLVDLLKIEVLDMDENNLRQMVERFKPSGVKLLAEKVENREMFNFCLELGFDYFQGYYFSKPVIVKKKSLEPGQLVVSKLISQISTEQSPEVIEKTFKEAPALIASLLRYINSASMGFRIEVGSIKHAINLIGCKKLMQWVILLSYASGDKNPSDDPLLQLVQRRAKTMEILANQLAGNKLADEAFTVGLLSLMDALYGMPIDEVLGSMKIGEQISQAILHKQGKLGHILKILLSLDEEQFLQAHTLLGEIGLDANALNHALLESIKWADEVSKSM
ncbi:MAG: EAL domain-containing protein [Pseudomonadota bacterium]